MTTDREPLEQRQLESELRSLEELERSDRNGELDHPLSYERQQQVVGEKRALRYALNRDDPDCKGGSLTENHMHQARVESERF